jgi:regulator of RNase E activity RraA
MTERNAADDPLVQRLAGLDTPTVSDALDSLGHRGAVSGIVPMTVKRRIVGRAITVKLGPPIPGAPKRHLGVATINMAHANDIIVVEHGRDDVSGWGGLLSRAAVAKGVAGVLIDGAFRDIDEARELGLPVYGRAAVPVTARGRIAEHGFDVPVTIAGVSVDPGDLVLADGSGIVFVAAPHAEETLRVAEAIATKERLMARDIDAGTPLDQVLGANYEDMLKGGDQS